MRLSEKELKFIRSYLIHLKCYKDIGIFEPWKQTLLTKVTDELEVLTDSL